MIRASHHFPQLTQITGQISVDSKEMARLYDAMNRMTSWWTRVTRPGTTMHTHSTAFHIYPRVTGYTPSLALGSRNHHIVVSGMLILLGGGFTPWSLSTTALYAEPVEIPAKDKIKEPISGALVPQTLHIEKRGNYTLLGLGVRQVTFLYISAYTIGIYVPSGWDKVSHLGTSRNTLTSSLIPSVDPEHGLAVCIQPVRTTDGSHLRSGLMRMWQGKLNAQLRSGHLSAQEGETIKDQLDQLKSAFPVGKVSPGEELVFITTSLSDCTPASPGSLSASVRDHATTVTFELYFNGSRRVGIMDPTGWIGRTFVECYCDGSISPSLRDSLSKGLAK